MDRPYSVEILLPQVRLSQYDNQILRRLSSMKGMFLDEEAFSARLAAGDPVLYEVLALEPPEKPGELRFGLSIVHPGKVGDEYNMTRGHFHSILETGEVYYCLQGEGFMVMENPEGEWAVEALQPGIVLYVPPRWAHRSVNTGQEADLVTYYVFPADAGHDYGSIEQQGFRKLVVEVDGETQVIDNPRWLPPEQRC
jgi:glucose-6-phosphate isomerase